MYPAVNRVREYIAAGDVFQVNLSQRFMDKAKALIRALQLASEVVVATKY